MAGGGWVGGGAGVVEWLEALFFISDCRYIDNAPFFLLDK